MGRPQARRLAAEQLGRWRSTRACPAWTFDDASGQYYLNQFLSSQPDLNWWNEEVRDAFDDILRFWFDRGVAGFRIDVCHSIIKDRELRDNPPATEGRPLVGADERASGSVYNACRPEVHDVLRRWRKLADGYDPNRVLIGETYVLDPSELALVLRRRRRAEPRVQLHAAALEVRRAGAARARSSTPSSTSRRTRGRCGPAATTTTTASRRAGASDDPAKTRAAMVMLMGLRGTPFLYYGDEIGMPDTDIPDDRVLDPVGVFHGARMGRDPERTPMHVDAASRARASREPGVEPWLPYGDVAACNVAAAAPRSRLDALAHARPHRLARRDCPSCGAARTRRCPSSDDRRVGVAPRATARSSRATSPTNAHDRRRRSPARSASRRRGHATASASTAR